MQMWCEVKGVWKRKDLVASLRDSGLMAQSVKSVYWSRGLVPWRSYDRVTRMLHKRSIDHWQHTSVTSPDGRTVDKYTAVNEYGTWSKKVQIGRASCRERV